MKRKRRKRPSGHGTVWQRGGNWWIQWRENGRRRSAKFPDEDTARRVLARILGDIAAGRGGLDVEKAPAPPLSKLAETWLARREKTHRAWRDDKNRWAKHLGPAFGTCKPSEVTTATIRHFVEVKLASGLSSTSVGHCVRLLSSFFTDVVEQGLAPANPAKSLPRATRRLFRNAHDSKQTPFLEKQEDIRRLFLALEQPFATLFAVQALAGLRPGEALALEWGDVNFDTRRILIQRQVRHGRVGPPKSGKPRMVPVIEPLAKILAEWKLATGGNGRLFAPENPRVGGRLGSPARFLGLDLVRTHLRRALAACGLPATLTMYQCGRHTFGAQHVMGGGSLATLREILGHSSVQVTERYGHLRPDLIRPADLLKLEVDLSRSGGAVVDLAAHRAESGAGSNAVATLAADEQGAAEVGATSA